MPSISSPDLTTLRTGVHKSDLFMTVCPATVIWSARVNDASIVTGAQTIAFDGGSGASWTAVGEYQEVWVGSSAGANDIDRLRIRTATSADGGVTGSIKVSSNSTPWSDNDYLTFICWYLPKPKRPRLGSGGEFYKDYDEVYTDQNEQPPPVCVAGENRAGFPTPAAVTFNIDLSNSYAVASGATITSYAGVAIYPTTNIGVTINPATGVGTVGLSLAGTYWVKFTVTDSNGKTQDTYRWYTMHNPQRDNAEYPHIDFRMNSLNGSWNGGGWRASISVWDDATLADIPDFAPVQIWQTATDYVTFSPDDSTTLINGYIRRDKLNQRLTDGVHGVDFEISTINDVVGDQFNYSLLTDASPSPTDWYQYDASLTPGRGVHHLLKWHSTVLECADVIGLTSNTAKIAAVKWGEGKIWDMANSFLRNRSIRHRLICDKNGRAHMVPDVQLLSDANRAALTITATIDNDDKGGDVAINREQQPSAPFVFISGISWDGTFTGTLPNATPICVKAPSAEAADYGPNPVTMGQQTWVDGTDAAAVAGRVFSAANNLYKGVSFPFSGNYVGVLEPYLSEFWQMSMLSTENARGIVWTNKKMILREISVSFGYDGDRFTGVILPTATFEPEAPSYVGSVTNCPSFPALGGEDFPVPVDEEAGGGLITASSVYRLPAQSLDWNLETAEATSDLILDPYWQTRQSTIASDSAIVWRCGTGYIKRSTDGGQTWTAVTPSTNPPNDAGDASPLTAATVTYHMLDADHSTQGKFVVLARGQTGGEWRTWYAVTTNDGTSWAWTSVLISGGGGFGNPTIGPENDYAVNTTSAVAWLDDSTIVAVYDNGTNLAAKVGSVSGTTISWGTAQTSTRSFSVDQVDDVVYLSSTTFCVIFRMTDESSDTYAACGTISGSSVTWGTTDTVLVTSGGASACRLTATTIAVARPSDFVVGSVSGTGATLAVSLNTPTSVPAALGTPEDIHALSGTSFVSVGKNGTDSLAVACTISGTTITAGSAVDLDGGNGITVSRVVGLSGTSFVSVMRRTDGTTIQANVSTVSGTTITAGTATVIETGTAISASEFDIAYLSSTEFALAFMDGSTLTVNSFDSSYTAGTEATKTVTSSNDVKIDSSPTSQNLAVAYLDNDGTPNNTASIITGSGGTTYQLKGQGIAVDKSGLYYYLTAWLTGDTLEFLVIDSSDDSLAAQTSLGSATLAQVDAKTYSAFPYTPYDFSIDCYVFGRMNAPTGLAGNQHVISSDTSGVLSSVISAWSSDYAGAIIDNGETLWSIRCGASSSQLYADGVLASALPFGSRGVNPHAIAYDYLQTTLYTAADSGASVMIAKSVSPFSTWDDITYAHGTSGGVNAVEVL